MKLWHIQQGTTSCDESTIPLASLPGLDKRTIYHTDRSHQSHILESPKKARLKTRLLACRPRGIQLQNGTYTWKHQQTSRCTVITPRNRQGWKWQPRYHNDSLTQNPNGNHPGIPIRKVPTEHPKRNPWSLYCWTPWMRWNNQKNQRTPSMAKNEPMDHRLCQRMHHPPTE